MGTLADKLSVKQSGGLADKLQPKDSISHGGVPLSLGQRALNVAGNIASSIEQPFVSLAAAPVQAVAKLAGAPDPYQNMPIPGLGDKSIPVSPLSLEAKGGDALKAGAEIGAVAAAPATLAGTIGVGAGIGAAQGAGEAMQQEQSAGQVAKAGGIGAAIGAATAGVIGGFSKLLSKVGEKIQTSVIRPTAPDLKDGFSMQTIKDYNLGGSLKTTLSKTQSKMDELTGQLTEKLAASPEKVNLAQVYQETAKELLDSNKMKGFGANTKIQNALDELGGEIAVVGNELSIPDAQIIKQAAGRQGAWQFGKQDAESNAREAVYNAFYSKLKSNIEKLSPEGVREINQQLGKLIPVANAVIRRIPVADRNNLISLSDMVGLVGSSLNPAALSPTIINLISKSGTAGKLISKAGSATDGLAVPMSLAAVNAQQGERK